MASPSQSEYLASVNQAQANADVGMDDSVNEDAISRADTANVRSVEFIDYAEALTNYEARDDVESLADRRAREAGDQFSDTNFVRAEGYDGF